ncbi:MAG: hypothetical protein HN994_02680, partial [Candidatus Marinimicrobia bacterium]|nr:hypothetical protein [Candidatus Neomarinimicrobiota bacterium]
MNKYLILILSLLLLMCERPERVWDNPNDSITTLDPGKWKPTDLLITRVGTNELLLSWKQDVQNIEGFKIDRKINNGDWTIPFITINKDQREWTDSMAVADNNKIYYYRLYAYGGKNESSKITVQIQDVSPSNVNVTNVNYNFDEMLITWQRYNDGDFVSYKLFYSTSSSGTQTVMDTITNINTTTYTINEFDPTKENWYHVRIINEFGLVSTGGSGETNTIDSPPNEVNVLMVDYDFDQMTVMWELSTDMDFKSYILQRSDDESGPYWNVEIIDDKATTLFSTTDYDPTVENWYWIKVTDFWDQETIGNPLSNNSDLPPNSVDVISVTYDTLEMVIEWEEYVPNTQRIYAMSISHSGIIVSNSTVPDNDFVSYELLRSDTEDGQYESISVLEDISTTSFSYTDHNPLNENWFKIRVTDYWGLFADGEGMTSEIDGPPDPLNITSVTYDLDEMVINWEQYSDNDFGSYELLYSETESGEQSSITIITDVNTTSHSLTEFNPTQENWFKIKVADFWNLTSTGNGMTNSIDSEPTTLNVTSVMYDTTEMVVIWGQSSDNDFVSYELLQSDSENGTYSSVVVITDQSTTSYSLTEFDPLVENWFRVT